MKAWQNMFEVKRGLKVDAPEGNSSWAFPHRTYAFSVYKKGTDERVTQRWYSMERDAQRGAAQIYNQIEKKLLG